MTPPCRSYTIQSSLNFYFCNACVLFGMLLNERETLDRVLQSVGPPSVENISIWEAGNRVLAQDMIATVALPRFDNSTMDGYAVRAEMRRAERACWFPANNPPGRILG